MRVCVCGGRDFDNKELLYRTIDNAKMILGDFTVINGGARGADKLSTEWAKDRGFEFKEFPADWDKFKNAAGPIRNQEMLSYGFNALIAFPGGKGTAHMISITKKKEYPC